VEQVAIHRLDAVRGGARRELIECAPARGVPVLAHEFRVAGEHDERARECLHVLGRHDDTGLSVRDDLGQAADVADDRRASALRRFERDHPETLTA